MYRGICLQNEQLGEKQSGRFNDQRLSQMEAQEL